MTRCVTSGKKLSHGRYLPNKCARVIIRHLIILNVTPPSCTAWGNLMTRSPLKLHIWCILNLWFKQTKQYCILQLWMIPTSFPGSLDDTGPKFWTGFNGPLELYHEPIPATPDRRCP
jgi:hypothetical protein